MKYSTLVDVVNYVGLPLLAIYVSSMFVFPWFAGDGSWQYVQAVWERWQSLNAGAIAFAASLIAFNISKFNENRQRERDFSAAKAFLPSTLGGLMECCLRSARIYEAMWELDGDTHAIPEHPDLPLYYRDVFSNCIRHADPAVSVYLSNIVVHLQVHDARLRDAIGETSNGSNRVVNKHALIVYILRLGELHLLMTNFFGFARGEEAFQEKSLTWDSFRSAYTILDLEADKFFISESMNLQAFTKRWLERAENLTSAM